MAERQQELGNVWLIVRQFYVVWLLYLILGRLSHTVSTSWSLVGVSESSFLKIFPVNTEAEIFSLMWLHSPLSHFHFCRGKTRKNWYSIVRPHWTENLSWTTRRCNNKDSLLLLPIILLANNSDPPLRSLVTQVTDSHSWAALNGMNHISISTATLITGSGAWSCCYGKPHTTTDFLSLEIFLVVFFYICNTHTLFFMKSKPIFVFHRSSSKLISKAGHCCVHICLLIACKCRQQALQSGLQFFYHVLGFIQIYHLQKPWSFPTSFGFPEYCKQIRWIHPMNHSRKLLCTDWKFNASCIFHGIYDDWRLLRDN